MSALPSEAAVAEINSELILHRTMLQTLPPTEPDYHLQKSRLEREIQSLEMRLNQASEVPNRSVPQYACPSPSLGDMSYYPSYHTAENRGGTVRPGAVAFGSSDGLRQPSTHNADVFGSGLGGNVATGQQSPLSPPSPDHGSSSDSSTSLMRLPSRKRARDSSGSRSMFDRPEAKSRRTTPSPQITGATTPSSYTSFGISPEDLELARSLGDMGDGDFQEMRRIQTAYEKMMQDRVKQEIWDAAWAKTLQDEENSGFNSATQGDLPNSTDPSQAYASPPAAGSLVSTATQVQAPPAHQRIGLLSQDETLGNTPRGSRDKPELLIDLVSDEETGDSTLVGTELADDRPRLQATINHKDSDLPRVLAMRGPFDLSPLNTHASPYPELQNNLGATNTLPNPAAPTIREDWLAAPAYSRPAYSPTLSHHRNDSNRSWLDNASSVSGQGSLRDNLAYRTDSHSYMRVSEQMYPTSYPGLSSHASNLDQVIANNPFSIIDPDGSELYADYPATARQMAYYDYVRNDPTKSREELKNLLENIRPDVELPPEGREGTPEAMKYPLMEHQKLGLTWMKNIEESSNKGGILADDMGLGKTIQALALLVSRPSSDPSRKTTLIVAPVALMKQWQREIETKLKPSHRLSTYLLHGFKRNASWATLQEYDVVLTTFGTLASEYKKKDEWVMSYEDGSSRPRCNLPLLGDESRWYRVIIDEAQCIKNRMTKAAMGARELQALTRFCLTGTPMMNGVGELHSLIEFLRIKPYNEAKRFRDDFTHPLKSQYETGRDRAMQKLQALLKAILLRRTKKSEIDGKPIINLPERTDEIQHAVFDKDQQEFYTALETRTRLQFNRYLKQGTVGRNYSNVLVLLLRLRQACCHPHLINDFAQDPLVNTELSANQMLALAEKLDKLVVARIKKTDAFECPVCYDAVENPAIFVPCGHDTCAECFAKISDQSNLQGLAQGRESSELKCPKCRNKISAKTAIDYVTFKKVHMPEEVTSEGPGNLFSDVDVDETDSETDEGEDGTGSDDDAGSLDDFVVADDVYDDDDDDSESDNKDGDGEYASGSTPTEKPKARVTTQAVDSKTRSGKQKSKSKKDVKGKGKAKAPTKTLAQLKKEGMRNAKARRKYMRRLGKDWIPSAKVDRCCEILDQIQADAEGEKTIVFSQFTSLLDLLEVPISRKGWGFKRYDGSMTATQRNDAVMDFTDNRSCKIMLVSLKAGNAGLNLVAASQVIILDPFWNPFIEEQAVDRTHRIGQLRPVKVHRILVANTVEDRIIALQEQKRKLIDGALDEKASQSIGRLDTRQLSYLFGVSHQ